MNLTAQQEEIASVRGGSCVVIACPGSGKTLVATERIARMIREGTHPDSIVAITFTNRAADEIEARIGPGLGFCGTIHGLAHLVLTKAAGMEGGLKIDFDVWDDEKREEKLAAIIEARRLKTTVRAVCAILDASNRPGEWHPPNLDRHAAIRDYIEGKVLLNAEDYNGLIDRALAILRANDNLLVMLRQKWRHATVDEYQDVDPAQDALIELLWPADEMRAYREERSLFVVGDPMQSIYRFRGGNPVLVMNRAASYATTTFHLSRSFRFGSDIACQLSNLADADPLWMEAMGYRIEAGACYDVTETVPCADEAHETSILVRELPGTSHDAAVLCRTNAQVERFFDVLALAGVGVYVPMRPGHDYEPVPGAVTLSTIHLAKGLEWDTVILPGWSEGLFPSQQAIEAEAKGDTAPMEDERRLAYVALSRAKRHAVILSPRRISRGPWEPRGVPAAPSRFIAEMGLELVGGEA